MEERRAVEREVTIGVPVRAVWKALTDAEELMRWFPLEASVKPGPNGEIRMRWGDAFGDVSRIEVWEEERHLRIAFPSEGPGPLVTDYYLRAAGGNTVLRVVTSGFGTGDEWDRQYEGVSFGWDFELRGLQHYLERHRGRDRAVAWVMAPYARDRDETWRRLTGPGGWLARDGLGDVREGASYAVSTSDGTELAGTVLLWRPPRLFVGTVEGFNDALLRLEMEGHQGVWLWMATWGVSPERIRETEARWRESLGRLLA